MNYRINYNVVIDGNTIYDKEIRVKNKSSILVAKVSLEDYLKRKYGKSFNRLIINTCLEENDLFNILFNLQ